MKRIILLFLLFSACQAHWMKQYIDTDDEEEPISTWKHGLGKRNSWWTKRAYENKPFSEFNKETSKSKRNTWWTKKSKLMQDDSNEVEEEDNFTVENLLPTKKAWWTFSDD
ncbi:uncharacterized protein LOC111622413 [Centruroides sculpturatus]|uniref:uncharacterized protein LOC111622413 n=1 Tax=Centruroides sculpturatus TaxID=218467 RepID=UPI000C6D8E85|nr:uncharacterized protein LOC111622413 [Centruroides sculpturatus]